MASKKRIANDLVAQKWYRMLTPRLKCLYIHLVCVANVAGVFEVDCDSFTFHVRTEKPFTKDEVFTAFGNRIQPIPNHPDKGLIVGYIAFQHSFSKASQQWEWVKKELKSVGLTPEDVERMREKEGEQLLLPIADEPVKKEKPLRSIIPPLVEWVREYCSTRNNGIDAEAFCDFYASKGWKVGNQRMKDWQAAVRTWEKEKVRGVAAPSPVKVQAAKSPIRKVF